MCCIVAFTSPLCVRASEPTATPGGSSSGEYVTINIPLTWQLNKHINFDTGQLYDDATGSVTAPINVIEGASYNVSIDYPGAGYTTGVMAFYYQDLNYLSWQELWTNEKGTNSAGMVVPGAASNFRITSDIINESDATQNTINLSITVSATYLEEHDLTEETLVDVVYADENRAIDDAADKFTEEYEILHEQEDYLLKESKSAFDNFFASFSWSDLAEYSAGFEFIGTWFNNFYNSHSAVAVSVGMASGLVILLILIRFKGH